MNQDAYNRLADCGIRPSVQRLAIMEFLLKNPIHPTVEEVYQGICGQIHTLSRTTVYNTLRMFSEHGAAQMITIDEHHVCYDGDMRPHVHFFCRKSGKVYDFFDEKTPSFHLPRTVEGHLVDEVQLYYKGLCKECASKTN